MQLSWKWLSELVNLKALGTPDNNGPEALAELLTRLGLEVESINRQGKQWDKVLLAQIVEKKPHPEADHLSLCWVRTTETNIKQYAQHEPEDLAKLGLFQVVCGASNMQVGDGVALAQIGAVLPGKFKIKKSKIRGIDSFGMLCSAQELGLEENSSGILILKLSDPSSDLLGLGSKFKLGQALAEVLLEDDTVLLLKITANRSDCLSHWGIARELGAALKTEVSLSCLNKQSTPKTWREAAGTSPGICVQVKQHSGFQAFLAVELQGVKVGDSPAWVVKRLKSLGLRSVNTVVDASNLVLLELGQPVHAYDADCIAGGGGQKSIQLRTAHAPDANLKKTQAERLLLLDATEIELVSSDLVIADAQGPLALAGIMGGQRSEVSSKTRNLLLELGIFDPKQIRRTSKRLQKSTEASYRFERGVDPEALQVAMERFIAWVQLLAGGEVLSYQEYFHPDFLAARKQRRQPGAFIRLAYEEVQSFLGFDSTQAALLLSSERIVEILTRLGCQLTQNIMNPLEQLVWQVRVPSYRENDLKIPEDLIEEIARSIGYSEIPSTLPGLSGKLPFKMSARGSFSLSLRAKESLVQSGFHEVLNLAFTHPRWLEDCGFSLTASTVSLLNPLSQDCQTLVPSLLPGLLKNVLDQQNHHFGSEPLSCRFFELRPSFELEESSVFAPVHARGQIETNVREVWKLAWVFTGSRFEQALQNERGSLDYYDLKAVVELLAKKMGTKALRFDAFCSDNDTNSSQLSQWPACILHPKQSAQIVLGKKKVGVLGRLHPAFVEKLKFKTELWFGELDWSLWSEMSRPHDAWAHFKSWPSYPPMERDFSVLLGPGVQSYELCQLALKAARPLAKKAQVFDSYQGPQISEGMTSLSVRVTFYDEGRSLEESETELATKKILEAWKKVLGVQLRD